LAESDKIKGVKGTPYDKPLFVLFLCLMQRSRLHSIHCKSIVGDGMSVRAGEDMAHRAYECKSLKKERFFLGILHFDRHRIHSPDNFLGSNGETLNNAPLL